MSALNLAVLAGLSNSNVIDVRDVPTHRPNCWRAAARAVIEAHAIVRRRPDLCPHGVRVVKRVDWRDGRRVIRVTAEGRSL